MRQKFDGVIRTATSLVAFEIVIGLRLYGSMRTSQTLLWHGNHSCISLIGEVPTRISGLLPQMRIQLLISRIILVQHLTAAFLICFL